MTRLSFQTSLKPLRQITLPRPHLSSEQALRLLMFTTNALTPVLYLMQIYHQNLWLVLLYTTLGISTLMIRPRISAPLAFCALICSTLAEPSLWIQLIASYCLAGSINAPLLSMIRPMKPAPYLQSAHPED